ncbi:MAG: hypothetical protein ACJ75B_05195 [Flavisolibacter sp.]
MKNMTRFFNALAFLAIALPVGVFAQKETYELVTYSPPKGWIKEVKEKTYTSYTKTNKQAKTYCQIFIMLSVDSKGSISKDFDSEWKTLVVNPYNVSDTPRLSQPSAKDGWEAKGGMARFVFNKGNSIAILTTMSGYNKVVSIVAVTNSQDYIPAIQALMESVEMKRPEPLKASDKPVIASAKGNFAFTTTNFDDGWTASAQEDWVQVTKGKLKALIHYPNKIADAYNSVLLDGLKNAWNILVAPRYSSVSNLEFKSAGGWEAIEFAAANAVEKATGKAVYVVLFKKDYSNGNGKYLEFISLDKQSFENEFGPYHQSSSGWDKMEKMASYNKFAVAASDLTGKWTNNFSGAIQYVNAYTGFDAGMDTHASAENFTIGPGNSYTWDLAIASGPVGNIKFQSVKSEGKFSMIGNWQASFSDIEGKARIYNFYFSCIKGWRILWMDDRAFAKIE